MNFFGKSYNEVEAELNETKGKIQLLEEKIEGLIQKDIDMTKILCETNSKIQQLEEKLQKNTTSLISFTSNSLEIGRLTSKTMFIDINYSNINIIACINAIDNNSYILIDDVKITSVIGISKLINELKNVKIINYKCMNPVGGWTQIPRDNEGYCLEIIKQIIKINNKVKLIMSFTYDFPYNWIKYILKDLPFDNILDIEISYSHKEDRDNTDILTCLDNNKKIMFTNTYTKPL